MTEKELVWEFLINAEDASALPLVEQDSPLAIWPDHVWAEHAWMVTTNQGPLLPAPFAMRDGDAAALFAAPSLIVAADAANARPAAVNVHAGLGGDTLSGSAGDDLIYGNQGADRLVGAGGSDTVYGGQDDDHIFGVLGDDLIYGNKQNDTLDGGWGDDNLFGGQGDDLIFGRENNDRIDGNAGNDTVYGNQGNDIFVVSSGYDQVMDFVALEDQVLLTAASGIATQTVVGGDLVLNFNTGRQLLLTGITEPLDASSFNGVATQTVIAGNVQVQDADGDILVLIGVNTPLSFDSFIL